MGTKVIANIDGLIEGDNDVMIVIDVNIIDDALQDAMASANQPGDYEITMTVPRATGGAIYTSPMLYQQVIDLIATDVSTKSAQTVTRYEIMVPGWNAYRDRGYTAPYFFDDFIRTSNVSGEIGELGWLKSGTDATNQPGGPGVFPGAVNVITPAVAGHSPYIYGDQTCWDDMGEATFIFHTNDITSCDIEVGFYYLATWRFALFYTNIAPGSWIARVRNGAGQYVSVSMPGVTPAAHQRIKLTITRLSATSTQFYMEEATVGNKSKFILPHANSTGAFLAPFFLITSKAAAQRFIVVDWYSSKMNVDRGLASP